ncbi:DMT family transporter [Celeribacter indicus]|uniref:EamA domain-containing protein n=1 Tax=Celeribacter indicus TaxID=1208324 RepID=A0A0B5E0J3_9RHOB|nr:DMT family transporter [Celeribacter indicus]AJE46940.1 hypothetical protein P73_2225 [Celeribacter indicus]SDW78128.1 EamA domain-containing membrane protein RarD [Celeribacter indicus]
MSTPQSHPLRAALWMAGSITGFSAMAVAGRKLTGQFDTFEILAYRSFFGLVVVLGVATAQGRLAECRPRALPLHLGRNLGHFFAQNLWLYALPLIPLAQLFALEFSYPILVGLGATLFLGERMTPLRALTSLMGFAGILLVARPFGASGFSAGLLAATACAFGFAASALFTKKLTLTAHVSILSIMFWMTFMQLWMGIACALADGSARLLTPAALPWAVLIALAGLGAHFCLSNALSLAPASVVTPMDFLRLPLIGVIGMVFYGEAPDPAVFLGAAVILAAIYLNIRGESRAARARAAT